jgi:Cd2+/Zn2+-exporting ATPase
MPLHGHHSRLRESENDGQCRRSAEEVGIGDIIVVKPGERIPLDGRIIEGYSALDTSALTGESLPRDVEPGVEVLSGSINKNGVLTIEVSKDFGESAVSKILDLVQNASGKKAPAENFITKFARYYTPVVVFAALALAVIPPLAIPGAMFADWLNRALVFLVVSAPVPGELYTAQLIRDWRLREKVFSQGSH